jgi:hypothetical protein
MFLNWRHRGDLGAWNTQIWKGLTQKIGEKNIFLGAFAIKTIAVEV